MSSQNVELQFQSSFRKRIRHPPCILDLLRHGVPSDMASEMAHSLLVGYVLTKGLSDVQARKMALTMMRKSVFFGSTSEATSAENFTRYLSQAREDPPAYRWNCEDIWSHKSLKERAACTAWDCEYYQARLIREPNHERRGDKASTEEEILTYVLNHPDSIAEGVRLELHSEGFTDEYVTRTGVFFPFNRVLWHAFRYLDYHGRLLRGSTVLSLLSRSPEIRPHVNEIARHMQRLQNRTPCDRESFKKNLNTTNARAARLRAQELIRKAEMALASSTIPHEIVLRMLRDQSNALLFETSDKTRTFDEDLDCFVTNLFAKANDVIPTPSQWLNGVFGGGWKPGHLYAVTASCENEGTDFSAWCADFAARRRFPTLFVSCGTSKELFAVHALARQSGIDGKALSRYREHAFDSETNETTLERIIEAGEQLGRGMARHLTFLEANAGTTFAHVRSALHTAQNQVGANEARSMLIILDQLRCRSNCVELVQDSVGERAAFDESTLLTDLKSCLRDFAVAIIAVFVGNKTSYAPSPAIIPSLTHLPAANVADYTLALHSGHVAMRDTKSEKTVDQLHLAREWYKRHRPTCRKRVERLFDEAGGDHSFDETCTYTRISLCGRDQNVLANPVIIYEWPYHRFRTLQLEPMSLEKHGQLSFDAD
jgi:hypothetical protein